MMRRFAVRTTPLAEDDLEAIHGYVSDHGSPTIADALLDRLVERLRSLEQFPNRGALVTELNGLERHFRQIPLNPYRCIYTIADDTVLVVAVLDGRRNVRSVLEQRLLQGRD